MTDHAEALEQLLHACERMHLEDGNQQPTKEKSAGNRLLPSQFCGAAERLS